MDIFGILSFLAFVLVILGILSALCFQLWVESYFKYKHEKRFWDDVYDPVRRDDIDN